MPAPEQSPSDEPAVHIPSNIGPYRLERLIAKGRFAVNYLAWDDKSQSQVVVKVPHASLVETSAKAQAALKEARLQLGLDHPNIAKVCDVGSAEGFPCFVVSKFVDGIDLAARLRQSRMEVGESVSLVATVAEALHHAHKQGQVHWDVKPGNILLDGAGNPLVADFGLALLEQDLSQEHLSADALAYRSPEQARGESHRVDRRSDIYSLGAVFYELLTGRKPFEANSREELLAAMKRFEIKPPGEIVESIPKELERICLKALARRASDRYPSAQEFAEDLRHWAIGSTAAPGQPGTGKEVFLCFVPEDQEYAVKLCGLLEARGLSCWMAPRDLDRNIGPDESALRAVEATTTTVLLMSSLANDSDGITRQIERATSKKKRVIPLRLENILLGKSLELHLSTSQWVDAWRLTPEQVAKELMLAHRDRDTGKEVFISYASQDQKIAFHLCQLVESKGVSCWIAPRDVPPGHDYGEAIVEGIEKAGSAALLLTNFSNASNHVAHEIERATSKRKRVIPVRMESIEPSRRLELHLSQTNWVDGWRLTPEQIAEELVLAHRRKAEIADAAASTSSDADSESRTAKIVPKGLRSFDENDADFFLELVPGPRDRNGLPDSIRFWKSRLEEKDANQTFSIGLIYGPSGCGKSSLVKAGLLPRLIRSLRVVYVEAGSEETESRLLGGLRRELPEMPEDLTLGEMLAAIRQGKFLADGLKVVLIIDQFEQWLHAHRLDENSELVQAIRHCDGGRLQCVVMVRDDFWMAATRFMRELEISLKENENSAPVDLFPLRHAEKVLKAFGRANGDLSAKSKDDTDDQRQFVEQAVAGLAEEGKVISVRLALFAEMVKGKPWSPATLRRIGGAQGVGESFLEETFSSTAALTRYRVHQKAAQAVLRALLPESGSNIKGHMKSEAELLTVSGYSVRPAEFEDLLRILDTEIRLITPTDGRSATADDQQAGQNYYQLTHDYLVPSLRDWLTRKQKETPQGRAELLLEDRANIWNARQENRQLPSLIQWFVIRRWTRSRNWTASQKKMMTKANLHHAARSLTATIFVMLATSTGLLIRSQVVAQQNRERGESLVRAVLKADTTKTAAIIEEMAGFRQWTDPLLKDENDKAEFNSPEKLHASLALLPVDDTQVDYLYGRLLDATPQDVSVIRDALAPHKDDFLDKLWAVIEKPKKGQESQRLRAAAALTRYDPESERWAKAGTAVVNDLVLENPVFLGHWSGAFFDVRGRLVQRLSEIYRDQQPERSAERSLATNLLANYAAENSQTLADLLMDADAKQFAVIYPKLKDLREQGLPILLAEIAKLLPKEIPSSDDRREILARRQANAAVALIRLNKPETVWPLLKHSPDPRVRSYIIHKLSPLGVNAEAILKQLDEEKEITIRRALLLSLGEFSETELTLADRQTFLPKLQEMYRMSPDPGLHAAAEWLLRKWEEKKWLEPGWTRKVNDEWAKDGESRLKRLQEIKTSLTKDKEKASRQWYVNSQGQTMVVLPGPVKFNMGSPTAEKGRSGIEAQHLMKIGRSFEIAAKSVTWEDYLKFAPGESGEREDEISPTLDCPANYISWFMAAKYCNWLSKAEGIPMKQWCYETDSKGEVTKLKENYLSLSGYRLPTEAEMEYVIRAESKTARYYGETDLLLEKYAWYLKNSDEKSWPVGVKKPNDFGLFDVQGNSYSWCQEQYAEYPNLEGKLDTEDNEVKQLQITQESRVLRGGSFVDPASNARSANRGGREPGHRNIYNGFRPARTFIP